MPLRTYNSADVTIVFAGIPMSGRADGALLSIERNEGAKVAAIAFASIKAVQVFTGIAEQTAALGDRIDKVSSKLGVNAQALQELRFAADQTGVAQQALDVGIQRFIRRASEAAKGTGVAKDALAELGVQLKDNHGNLRPVDELLGDVAEGFKGTKTDADRVRLAFKLFDTEGVDLVNTLKGGRGALEALRKKARDTGGILDTELIQTSVEFTDTASELNLTFQGVRNIIAKALLPAFINMMKTFIDFIKRNREFIQQRLGTVLSAIGRGVATVARLFFDAADAARAWLVALGPTQKRLLTIGAVAAGIAILLALPGGAIIALGILIGLLIENFQRWREGGQSVIGDLVGALDMLLMQFPVLPSQAIDGVVLHDTGGGSAAGTIRWFANPQSRVSAHFVVGRSGRIVQMVPLERAAWHAGIAEMVVKGEARGNPNLCSVGIELANHGYLQRDSDGDFWWELGREMKPYRRAPPSSSTLVYDNGMKVEGWWERYPDGQLESLDWLLGELAGAGCPNNIVGHEEIAMPLGRKRDPGPLFAWGHIERSMGQRTHALP